MTLIATIPDLCSTDVSLRHRAAISCRGLLKGAKNQEALALEIAEELQDEPEESVVLGLLGSLFVFSGKSEKLEEKIVPLTSCHSPRVRKTALLLVKKLGVSFQTVQEVSSLVGVEECLDVKNAAGEVFWEYVLMTEYGM